LLIVLGFVLVISSPDQTTGPLGFLLLVGGLFGLIIGVILTLYSLYRSRRLARTLAGNQLLVAWTVQGPAWQRYLANQRRRAVREAITLSLTLILIVPLFMLWDTPTTWSEIGWFIAALIGLSVVSWVVDEIRLQLLKTHGSGQIYITTEGVVLNDEWHTWHQWGRWLESVQYAPEPENELVFTYCKPRLPHTSQTVELRVPVAYGYQAEARQVVKRLAMKQ
jgi:drug/metabolite transporter (DMT)-like permease